MIWFDNVPPGLHGLPAYASYTIGTKLHLLSRTGVTQWYMLPVFELVRRTEFLHVNFFIVYHNAGGACNEKKMRKVKIGNIEAISYKSMGGECLVACLLVRYGELKAVKDLKVQGEHNQNHHWSNKLRSLVYTETGIEVPYSSTVHYQYAPLLAKQLGLRIRVINEN